jgi:spermidine synthase
MTILIPVVFAAGLSFLVYEVVWDRLLSLYLGITVHASTIVVSSYMAGLSAGAYYFSRKAQGTNDPIKFVSKLLLGSAVVNIIVYKLLMLLPVIYSSGAWGMNVDFTAYAYSLLLIFSSAFFIGGFMPVISRIFVMSGNNTGQAISNTFGVETLGSAAGGLAAGFFLLGSIGSSGSVYVAGSLNALLAVLIFKGLKLKTAVVQEIDAKHEKRSSKIKKILLEKPRTAMTAVFVSGLCGFIFQITAMRIFMIYLTNTSYTFSLIVSVTIGGYFIGSMIFKRLSEKEYDTEKILLFSMFLMAVAVGSAVIIFVNAPGWIILPLHEALKTPGTRILLPPFLLSLVTVLPQSILSGIVFTSAVKLYKSLEEKLSAGFGRIYFFNTAGAFAGPFAAAFFLIPNAGAVRTLLIISFILSFVSAGIYFYRPGKNIFVLLTAAAFLTAALVYIFKPAIMILPPSFSKAEREILFYKEAVEATIVVGRDKQSGINYTYFNNNSVIGSSYDAIKAVKLLGHIPFLTGQVPQDVLIVGFGIGVTTSTVLQHPEVRSVVCVELAEDLKEAAGFYKDFNNDVVSDPRLKIIGDDGRHYLQKSGGKFDLISSDPTHPVLGSGALYSKGYFQLCYDHLSDDGMVTQYLPLHKLLPKDYAGIIKTFNSVFENTTVWLGHTHTILVGTKEPLKIDFADFKAKSALIKDQYLYNDPYSLASFLILDKNSVAKLTEGSEICSDDRSYLDFFKFDSFLPENWAYNAENILNNIKNSDVFYNVDDPEKLDRFRASTSMVLQALMRSMSGDMQGYVSKLYEALSITPENQEISFLIKLEGLKQSE